MRSKLTRREAIAGTGAALALAASCGSRVLAQSSVPASGADAPAFWTVRRLAQALAAREISAVELLDLAIRRIEALDGKINAVVVRDFERARAAAREADAALARGERGPLTGIPMTVKEAFNVAGLPTTWGFPNAKDWRPPEDAVTVARLKRAGAIVIGKTNVPIRLADWQSYNEVYGTTNNPWDLSRTPGGSSGGSAAALAAGFTPLELGSDIGGSLRTPAAYCGVFAHKPTLGLIPVRGHIPPRLTPIPFESDLSVVGPMARSAYDLAHALDVLAGPDDYQAIAYRLSLPPPRHAALKDFRILVLDTHPLLPTAASIRGALSGLADNLAKAGAKVTRQSPLLPDLARTARIYVRLLLAFFGADLADEPYRRLQEEVAAIPADVETLAVERSRGLAITHRDWRRADRVRTGLAQRWREFFKERDVVICPAMPTLAFPHDHSQPQRNRRLDIDGEKYSYDDQLVWPGIATLNGLPATAVPIARSEVGLPIGVQIVGPYLEDRTTLALAALIEREFGGFVAPPGFGG